MYTDNKQNRHLAGTALRWVTPKIINHQYMDFYTNDHGGFIIRIYGIMINDKKEVLLSDEYRFGMLMTKFPGGGMKYGEGPEDCLHREALEELGQEVEIIQHFYTTGFYQKALFHEEKQLISIYYLITPKGRIKFAVSGKLYDFPEKQEGSISFRWKKICSIEPEDLTFPVDRFVAKMLKEQHCR